MTEEVVVTVCREKLLQKEATRRLSIHATNVHLGDGNILDCSAVEKETNNGDLFTRTCYL